VQQSFNDRVTIFQKSINNLSTIF